MSVKNNTGQGTETGRRGSEKALGRVSIYIVGHLAWGPSGNIFLEKYQPTIIWDGSEVLFCQFIMKKGKHEMNGVWLSLQQ